MVTTEVCPARQFRQGDVLRVVVVQLLTNQIHGPWRSGREPGGGTGIGVTLYELREDRHEARPPFQLGGRFSQGSVQTQETPAEVPFEDDGEGKKGWPAARPATSEAASLSRSGLTYISL